MITLRDMARGAKALVRDGESVNMMQFSSGRGMGVESLYQNHLEPPLAAVYVRSVSILKILPGIVSMGDT